MTGCDPNLEGFHKSDVMKHAGNDEMSGYASVSIQISLTPDNCVCAPCYTDFKRNYKLGRTPRWLKITEQEFTVLP